MIEIDGNYKEGGGQIVRTALALSAITQKPCRVTNIRKGRPAPGLKMQHLVAVRTLKEVSNAQCTGDVLGSETLVFRPGPCRFRDITVDIQTAGSITLFLQAILPPLLAADRATTITVRGGTDVSWSQPVDHFASVFLPVLQRRCPIFVKVVRRGYYPKGGGEVVLTITPPAPPEKKSSEPLRMTHYHEPHSVRIVSHSSALLKKPRVAERQADAASAVLHTTGLTLVQEVDYYETDSPGSGITIVAEGEGLCIGADALGKRGISAEQVGREAALMFIAQLRAQAPVDVFCADQLIPFLGLWGGEIVTTAISDHTLTNIMVTEKFLPVRFLVEGTRIRALR
ncbi:RNA 3'-phosphate cyclase [Candidatus Woesearchaeota archaeon CG_4_10_14_0_8_um_filter_47_5]|nr:MAG: RNA 3'-phosphate cyclase [Candidatus Woesearchaeota archaeon CG_4_10_14_0_8_um_filter_47_5]